MRAITASLFALALLAAAPDAAQAQQPELAQGSRVRVSTTEGASQRRWIAGTVLAVGADSLVLRPDRGAGTVALGRGEIRAVQVSLRTRSRGKLAARYALIGGLVGASVGAVVGATDDTEEGEWEIFSREEMAAMGATFFGLPSAAIGGVLGWRAGGDQWEDAGLPAAPVVSVRPDGAVGIAVRLRL